MVKKITSRQERRWLMEQLSADHQQTLIRDQVMTDIPPHAYCMTDKGEHILTETNYRMMAACKANMVLMSQRFSMLTLVEIIMDLEPRIRDLILDEERRSDWDDPSRIRKLPRREDDTDAQYHFRVAKRLAGLRLYRPGREGVPQRQKRPYQPDLRRHPARWIQEAQPASEDVHPEHRSADGWSRGTERHRTSVGG